MTAQSRDTQILEKIQGDCNDIMFTHTEYEMCIRDRDTGEVNVDYFSVDFSKGRTFECEDGILRIARCNTCLLYTSRCV